ncbi:hypothetical protein Poli38472_010815 [Pythium oligandrum]|uniref:FYVE-type domain-containing protein n=1 Tax=Pythium oligandrum TaxID=41045 RepID=A0A8K1CGJ2_PYTOL|nr:hypothetical protein Poli38472_010815 [Pythium oligandrum]|eukprot:TMW61752.1 hypothetical protein Poli38472_010815 [Pythium oligandrum]
MLSRRGFRFKETPEDESTETQSTTPPVEYPPPSPASASSRGGAYPMPAANEDASLPPTPSSSSRFSSRMSLNGSSLFNALRGSSSRGYKSETITQLEGKQWREAKFKQQQREEQEHAPTRRPARLARYDPQAYGHTAPTTDTDEDGYGSMDDDFSTRGTPRQPQHSNEYSDSEKRIQLDRRTEAKDAIGSSRMSIRSFGRLSLAHSNEYKAKKYEVDWRKDDDCVDCQVCHSPFTKLSRRRHHCRLCGDIICGECSQDQVHVVSRFPRPKRACIACFGLLEAMHQLGDKRVSIYVQSTPGTREWTQVRAPSQNRQHRARNPNSTSPPPTPVRRYHDRKHEIQRVTAAGNKARRAGTESRFCAISAQWLRAWLTFTRTEEASPYDQDEWTNGGTSKKTRTLSGNSVMSSPEASAAPGPIENLPLLEVRKGCLTQRSGLTRCERRGLIGVEQRGDYQIIPLEVWEVLYRYYGGGPWIEVVVSDQETGQGQWVVDTPSLLRSARALSGGASTAASATNLSSSSSMGMSSQLSMPPQTVQDKYVERALVERHDPYNILVSVANTTSGGMGVGTPSSSGSYTPSPSSMYPPSTIRSTSDGRTPVSASGSARRERTRSGYKQEGDTYRRVTPTSAQQARPSTFDMSRQSVATGRDWEPELEPQGRATQVLSRRGSRADDEPSAAQAASAFALAMKQARLNAQRAIAGTTKPPEV